MRFSLYSELQLHPGKTAEQLYGEVLEQMRERRPPRLRRLRGDRALLLSEVLGLDEPDGALRRRGAADEEHPLPHDAARAPVPQPDRARERHPRDRHPHRRPLRMGRRPRTRLAPAAGRRAARRARAPEVRGGGRPAAEALENERFSHEGTYFNVHRLARRAVRRPQVPRLPRRHVRPHVHARRRARLGRRGAAAPARTSRSSSRWTSTARRAPSTAPSPTSSGSTPAISTRTRDRAPRGARAGSTQFIDRERLTADRVAEAARRRAEQGRLRLLHGRDHGVADRDSLRQADRGRLRLGRHAGARSSSASRRRARCARASRRSAITVNAGGAPHWMAIKNQELFAHAVMPHFGRNSVADEAGTELPV